MRTARHIKNHLDLMNLLEHSISVMVLTAIAATQSNFLMWSAQVLMIELEIPSIQQCYGQSKISSKTKVIQELSRQIPWSFIISMFLQEGQKVKMKILTSIKSALRL